MDTLTHTAFAYL